MSLTVSGFFLGENLHSFYGFVLTEILFSGGTEKERGSIWDVRRCFIVLREHTI
jgi:hypothetical protein